MKRSILVLTIVLFCASFLYAYQISPMSASFEPSGVNSVKAYTIINDSDAPIAIEVSALKRMIDIEGNEYTEPAGQYFSIQPSKMIIKPQTTQIVRVQYRGPRTVTKEMSFRIVAEQIPYSQGASVSDGGQMINFLFVYSTSAYVAPSKVVERVVCNAFRQDEKIKIVVENTGSVHQLLNEPSLALTNTDGSSYTLSESELAAIDGKNLLTDSTIEFYIDTPPGFEKADNIKAQLEYDYKY